MNGYKLILVFVCCCWLLLSLVEGHIHSHKIPHVETDKLTLSTWVYALLSSALVGACGVFPLIVNRWVCLDSSCKHKLAFKAILYFAVGGLLGDVFLHLLPETWASPSFNGTSMGVWVLTGLFSFLMIEKVVKYTELESSDNQLNTDRAKGQSPELITATRNSSNGIIRNADQRSNSELIIKRGKTQINGTINGFTNGILQTHVNQEHTSKKCSDDSNDSPTNLQSWFDKDITGYLNLVANCTDNFTHGLAIATSYVASPAVGLLTTLAILCHEIPHEIGDFAILLNSGFSLKEATKAQMTTACGGLVGVIVGLTAEHFSSASSWLLPFTAGGFLYIALVSIIPELLETKSSPRQSVVEFLSLVFGVAVMAFVTVIEKRSCECMPSSYH